MAKKKRDVYAIDCETDPFKYGRTPKPFAWGIYGQDDDYQFWGNNCTDQFMEYCQDIENAVFYAHNGGKFDFFFLLPYLDPEIFIINGRIAKATMNNGAIELRDSWLILPLPLKAHGKIDIDYAKMEAASREQHKKEILIYLREDCSSLYEWVTRFKTEFGDGLTLAGTAFKQLKKTDYLVENTNKVFDTLFRRFYFGGRVQCFETGAFHQPLKFYDIKSAYPFAMTFKHWQGSAYRQVLKLPDGENGSWFARVIARSYGALPYKGSDGKLYFPNDGQSREFFAGGWEINAGLETGTLEIEKVMECYVPTFRLDFCEYVDKFFALKEHAEKIGDPVLRQFAKLLLNSCYGKFGQDGSSFEKFLLCEFGDIPESYIDKDGIEHDWDHYADTETLQSIFSRPDPSDRYYNVATAASITSFVRAHLWRTVNASERPLYCDTDSLICENFGGDIGDNLGQWGLEADITAAYIAQRKMYALELANGKHKTASKGVRLTFDQIKNGVINGQNICTEKDAPAFSLKYGARYMKRITDFENISKNACNNPPI